MKANPMQPYDELPEIPPPEMETVAVLRKLTRAARALAELNAASRRLPDPSMLINTIPLQEAQASSAIENIVTTQDKLYRAAATTKQSDDPATHKALRYRTALRDASTNLAEQGFSLDLLVQACRTIQDDASDFRQGGDFVHLRDGQGRPIYTPPANMVVLPRLLKNLGNYILHDTADPLLKMAVAHYQFEAIHPFRDGNGRTGRILNLLILQAGGLLDLPILYLSKYIIERKDVYYELLSNVTMKGDWEAWILWMLDAVEVTSRETLARIDSVLKLQAETAARLQKEAPSLDRHGLLQVLFSHPYCKISHLVEAGIAKRQTASIYLHELEAMGILQGQREGREMIYLHSALIDAVR
jgi:Fic family protein